MDGRLRAQRGDFRVAEAADRIALHVSSIVRRVATAKPADAPAPKHLLTELATPAPVSGAGQPAPAGIFGLPLRRSSGRGSRPHNADMQNDKPNKKLWPRLALLGASLSILTILILTACDLMGIGPNLGLRLGYYGRLNRILARIEASPDVEALRTTLHRDQALEDFYITVRTQDGREVDLRFEEAHTRPFDELLEELKRVGL